VNAGQLSRLNEKALAARKAYLSLGYNISLSTSHTSYAGLMMSGKEPSKA
jgi:hypothetical protein